MAKTERQLHLKIEQAGKVMHHRLRKNDRLTIGQDPKNDITVYGEKFPKRHTLLTGKNNHFQISLKQYMQGEVAAGESRLSFKDLLLHGLLPKKGDNFTYPVTRGKRGYVMVGDAKISFEWMDGTREAAPKPPKFIGYSWAYATAKELGRDLPFKAVLLFFIIVHAFLLNYMSGLPTDVPKPTDAQQVPERLTRIIVRNPTTPEEARRGVNLPGAEEEAESTADKPSSGNRAKQGDREIRPENQGLLGLLTGTGQATQSNNLADFLLDEGLVEEMDQVMASSDLSVGKGTGEGDDLDELFAVSEAGGGIDDILEDMDSETSSGGGSTLGEKGRIDVDRIGSITGNEDALGKRSEESVRRVIQKYQGRLTYIYKKYLKHNPDLVGKIVAEVVIDADGSVADVTLVTSTLGHPELEREILNFIRKWEYTPIDQGQVTVTYPLFFNKIE